MALNLHWEKPGENNLNTASLCSVQGRAGEFMKHRGARKAKDVDFDKHGFGKTHRRAARIDLTWRASELAETDVWQRRTEPPRKSKH